MHPCPRCNKKFFDVGSLSVHLGAHKLAELPWECRTCGATFTTGTDAQEHSDETDHSIVSGPVPRP